MVEELIETLEQRSIIKDINDVLIKIDVDNCKNKNLLEQFRTCKDEKLKLILERGIKLSVFYKQRAEKILLDEDFVKLQCNIECDRSVVVSDEYGKFKVQCPFVENNFCLISEKILKNFKDEEKLIKIFSPYRPPSNFYNAEIDKVSNRINKKLQEYLLTIHEGMDGLIIIGNIGTGKTSILYLIIKKLLDFDLSVKYYTANDIATYIIRENFEELQGMYCDVVMIDDLGREYLPEKESFVLSQLDNFIDLRYRDNKTTIITSNLSKEELEQRYPRIYDRLKEKNHIYQVSGMSLRKEINNWRE